MIKYYKVINDVKRKRRPHNRAAIAMAEGMILYGKLFSSK